MSESLARSPAEAPRASRPVPVRSGSTGAGSTGAGSTGARRREHAEKGEQLDPGTSHVPTAAHASEDPIGLLGRRIREARLRRGMSVRGLARLARCSASMISQIESSRVKPSVSTLYAITSALDISTDSLFGLTRDREDGLRAARDRGGAVPAAAPSDVHRQIRSFCRPDRAAPDRTSWTGPWGMSTMVLRRSERPAIDLERGVHWEQLTPHDRKQGVEFREVRYDVGGGSAEGDPAIQHNGREYCVVLSGLFAFQIGFERGVLEEGDSLAFDSTLPHRFWNAGEVPVRTIWFVLDRWARFG